MRHDPALHLPATNPTTDLYFAWSMAPEISEGTILRRSATVFETDSHVIVCRKGLAEARAVPQKRLIYLVDDDVAAGIRSREVPVRYRLKLAAVEGRQMAGLAARATLIVTGSPHLQGRLAARHPRLSVALLPPAWPVAAARRHRPNGPLSIGVLMGMSHARNLRPLYPVLGDLLRAREDLRLTISANLAPPPDLARHPRVTVLPVLDWPGYLAALGTLSIDLLLYPLFGACAFNAGRSDNKLGEAATLGAALMVPRGWVGQVALGDDRRVLKVGPEGWGVALAEATAAPERIACAAGCNQAALLVEDRVAAQRRFWRDVFGLRS